MKARRTVLVLVLLLTAAYAVWLPLELRALRRVKLSDNGTVATITGWEYSAAFQNQLSYQIFDEVYPPDWPAWLLLPQHSYLAYSGRIIGDHAEKNTEDALVQDWISNRSAVGIVQLSRAEVLSCFRSALQTGGLEARERADETFSYLDTIPKSGSMFITIKIMALKADPRWTLFIAKVVYH
jgi:hypothetical protein